MMLQLPIWRYPAVVIFSLALHGILLLIIFSEYRRNPPPSQIEWFDLREMRLSPSKFPEKSQSASAISAVSKKKEIEQRITNASSGFHFAAKSDSRRTKDVPRRPKMAPRRS